MELTTLQKRTASKDFRLEDVVGLQIGVLNSMICEFNVVSSLTDAMMMQASSEGLGIDIMHEEAGVEE